MAIKLENFFKMEVYVVKQEDWVAKLDNDIDLFFVNKEDIPVEVFDYLKYYNWRNYNTNRFKSILKS